MPPMSSPVYRGIFVLALVLSMWSAPGMAFGPSGHRYVGYLAERYLCAETREALVPLLAAKSVPGRSLAQAGVWPDTIRREPRWRHSGPWHYINVDDRGSLRGAIRRTPDNVLTALQRFEAELRNASLPIPERAVALRFVVHFVADIHQPLHVGRAADRGGNEIAVRMGGKPSNLHRVWDGQWLWKKGGPGPQAMAHGLPMRPGRTIRQWQAANPLAWAQESLDLRPRIYGFESSAARTKAGHGLISPPVELSQAYLNQVHTILRQRLEMAGVRVAGHLNAALGAPAGCQPTVASGRATH